MPARDRKRLAHIIAETRTRTIIDETITDMWLDEPVPAPMAAAMTTRRDLVLTVGSMSKSFWGGLRIGWIRAERSHHGHHRRTAPVDRHGHRDSRTARRRKASRAARRAAAGAARDPSDTTRGPAVAAAAAPARLATRTRRRRDVAVGAVARADEHRAVGGRVAAGPRPARRDRASGSTAHWSASSGCPTRCPRTSSPRRSNCWPARGTASPGRQSAAGADRTPSCARV